MLPQHNDFWVALKAGSFTSLNLMHQLWKEQQKFPAGVGSREERRSSALTHGWDCQKDEMS